ncbi:MAG: hypothetical protein JXB36_05390 [Gammaproteobacteria bacterium]|nr:hypothetical protein [Gammaproteobacteria bacterium]
MLAEDLSRQIRRDRFFARTTGWIAALALLLGLFCRVDEDLLIGAPDPEIGGAEARLRTARLAADVQSLDLLTSEAPDLEK